MDAPGLTARPGLWPITLRSLLLAMSLGLRNCSTRMHICQRHAHVQPGRPISCTAAGSTAVSYCTSCDPKPFLQLILHKHISYLLLLCTQCECSIQYDEHAKPAPHAHVLSVKQAVQCAR